MHSWENDDVILGSSAHTWKAMHAKCVAYVQCSQYAIWAHDTAHVSQSFQSGFSLDPPPQIGNHAGTTEYSILQNVLYMIYIYMIYVYSLKIVKLLLLLTTTSTVY